MSDQEIFSTSKLWAAAYQHCCMSSANLGSTPSGTFGRQPVMILQMICASIHGRLSQSRLGNGRRTVYLLVNPKPSTLNPIKPMLEALYL